MKKIFIIVCLSFLIFALNGCIFKSFFGSSEQSSVSVSSISVTPTVQAQLVISDYFSYKADTKYVYDGIGNEFASYDVYVDYLGNGIVQLRKETGGSTIVNVLKASGGMLSVLTSKGEIYYREDFMSNPGTDPEILLKEPLVKGTTWTVPATQSVPVGNKRYISNVDVEIITPAGVYSALEVTTEDGKNRTLDYYAADVGLVKSIFKSGETEISSTLSKIENNVPLIQTVRFFYPDVINDKIFYVDKQLSFYTNDSTPAIFEKVYKELLDEKFGKILSSDAKVNSMMIDKNNIVNIDFSQEFLDDMNAGSDYESMILQCITNTLGVYYDTDKVIITVAGKLYSSGHIELKEGEFFTVDLTNSHQY